LRLALLQLAQIILQAIEALFPETAVTLEPVGRILERAGGQSAWTPLRFAPPLYQAGALQHFQVLRNGRHAHLERLCQLGYRSLAGGETSQDRAASRVCECREGGVEAILRFVLLNHSVT
jgi:hypothetical protein